MKGITFGDLHSYKDLSLILTSKTIGSPQAKTNTVDIPGGDGSIDLTDYFGEIYYYNRTLTFEFSTIIPQKDFLELFSKIQNALHGKKIKVILDEDDEFYYYGRISVDEWKSNKRIGKIVIEVDAEPYKYKVYKTSIIQDVSGTAEAVLVNLKKSVVPKITTTSDVTIVLGNTEFTLGAGTYEPENIPEFILKEGNNIITITGTSIVTFEYQEGEL